MNKMILILFLVLLSVSSQAETPTTADFSFLHADMQAALKRDVPKFELWQLKDFSQKIKNIFTPSEISPSPAVALGDFDGDGKQDAILFGKGEQTMFDKPKKVHQYVIVNYSAQKKSYQVTNFYAYEASHDSQSVCKTVDGQKYCGIKGYLKPFSKEKLLKIHNPKNCKVTKDQVVGDNVIFYYPDRKAVVSRVKNNFPTTLCEFFWNPNL